MKTSRRLYMTKTSMEDIAAFLGVSFLAATRWVRSYMGSRVIFSRGVRL